MENLGILEMAEMESQIKGLELPKASDKQHAVLTILGNDFQIIPEGFTAVYLRDEECQIVPNDLLPKIKQMSTDGFDDVPEDHELHLFTNWRTAKGFWLNARIIELVIDWMYPNL